MKGTTEPSDRVPLLPAAAGWLLRVFSGMVIVGAIFGHFSNILLVPFTGVEDWLFLLRLTLCAVAMLLAFVMLEFGGFLQDGEFRDGTEAAILRALNRFLAYFGAGCLFLVFMLLAVGHYRLALISLVLVAVVLWGLAQAVKRFLRHAVGRCDEGQSF
ncbi:MAG: hypothetical protein Q7Q71_02895 [Verrucomicrobiota bacterium JB023]|nr:hypothetical protein [Verrucomicrobiota bacterium JB023]